MIYARSRLHVVLSLLLVCSLIVPLAAAIWAAPGAPPPRAASTDRAPGPLGAGVPALTILLTPGALAPQTLQVVAGETVTFQNDDSQTRTLLLDVEGAVAYELFLPAAVRSGGSRTAGVAPAEPARPRETIVLDAGESTTRTFAATGNLIVTDAADATLSAAILIIDPPLPQEGPVGGVIVDYVTKLPIAGAQVRTLDGSFETTTNSAGEFGLNLPPGEHTIVLFASGYSFANRVITIRPFTPATVQTIELVPLDDTVTPIGNAGGTAVNSAGNTDVVFAAGAVSSTVPIRLTDLPVDEYAADFAALPGPFTDGRIPLGFVLFEPDGTQFAADAVWTIDYDGDLPVGTYVPCFYWIEDEARWGEPVDGEVVDLGGGQKGLRATLPHFSSYGFAAAPPPEPQPPQLAPDVEVPEIDAPLGPEDNPNESDQDQCLGSQINLASGELCQTVGTLGLPAAGGVPTQVTARYYSRAINYQAQVDASFTPPPGSLVPDVAGWVFNISGRVSSGGGFDAAVTWDGRDDQGNLLAPGIHMGTLLGFFAYNVDNAGGGADSSGIILPPRTCQSGNCGQSIMETRIPWPLAVVRNDLSPFGIGWFSPHDTLLVDGGDWVTIVQHDGRQVVFQRDANGDYSSPPAADSLLVKNPDGTWTRTYRNGAALSFNVDGRLTRIADRYGNDQTLFYESNGVTLPAGTWGLTTRLRRLEDSSGNQFDYAYDENGWLATITDSVGRVYSLEHDAAGHLTAFVDPLGQRQEYSYDSRSMMTGHSDARLNTTSYALDDKGRVLSRTWPTGTALTAVYTTSATTVTTDNGTPITTTLDARGNPLTQFNGVFTVRMTYSDDLRPTGSDAPTSFLFYDEEGRLIESVTDVRAVYERDAPYDQVSRATTSSGLDMQFSYSGQGAMTAFSDALGQTYLMSYDAQGQPLSITDPLGNTTSYVYDQRGLVTAVTDPLGRSWQLVYDAAGNLVSATDPNGGATALTYDALNRVTELVDALGGVSTRSYDANGNLSDVVDASGRTISYAYDALDRVTGIAFPDGGTTTYGYDGNGNTTSVLDARGLGTIWTYDAANRPVGATVANEGSYRYAYDRVGQPISITVDSDDGTGLATDIAYIDGLAGYPIYERQVGSNLPLTATVDYAYGGIDFPSDLGQPVPEAPQTLIDTYLRENSRQWPTAPTRQAACTTVLPGVISQTLTLTNTNGAYCFGSPTANTTTLIEPGVTVVVSPGVTLAGYPADILEVQGTLLLNGTDAAPVVVTSQNPGLSNSYQILVSNSGEIDFTHVLQFYGGFCNTFTCGNPVFLMTGSGQATIRHSHLGAESTFRLLSVSDQASLAIHDSTLGEPSGENLRGTLTVNSTGTLSVTNSLLLQMGLQSNISTKGVRVNDRNVAGVLNGGNTFVPSGNQPSRVYVTSTGSSGLIADATWYGLDRSNGLEGLYFYFAGMKVNGGATLSIHGPQNILAWYNWNSGGNGPGGGHIRLLGTAAAPVVVSRVTSQFGGFVAYDGGSLYAEHALISRGSQANVWVRGIGASAVISSSQLINGGGHGAMVRQGSLTVHNSVIANNAGDGLRHEFNTTGITVTNSVIVGNGGLGVFNNRPETVHAPGNFWGAATGPAHATNPSGTGQAVTDGVHFLPWMPTPGDGRLSGTRLRSNDNGAQETTLETDALGRVARFDARGYAEFGVDYTYDGNDRLLARTPRYGLPITDTFSYDGANQLLSLDVTGAGGSVLSYAFDHDANGNVIQVASSVDGVLDYTYDALNRLTGVDGGDLSAAYTYDAAGNRSGAGGVTYSYDAGGRLVGSSDGTTYSYDAAGNLLTKTDGSGTSDYTWNGRGQLVRIDYPDGSYSAYRYDDAGRRISRRLPDGSERFYVYMQDLLTQELDESGGVVASYTYDGLDRPVSLWRDGETYYYVLDHLGSVRALVDSGGVITATYQYDPWGNQLAATGSVENPLRWAAREYDDESGLYYLRFRYYDPAVGRFISRDPLGIRGGHNLYAYAHNNPVTWIDPLGLQPRVVFEFLRNGRQTMIEGFGTMRNLARGLRNASGAKGPYAVWSNVDENGAKQIGRIVGRVECKGGDMPYVRVRNKDGKHIMDIFYGNGIPQALPMLGAVVGPLAGLGGLAGAVNADSNQLLQSLDAVLSMFMPGLMVVDPGVLNPGAGGIPEA